MKRSDRYDALNPRSIWIVVILVMAISAAGYVLVRILGARFGLPIAGLASGFISSAATIGAMGTRVRRTPDVVTAAVAGAALLDGRHRHSDVPGAGGHQHGHPARAVDTAALCRHRRHRLRRRLYGPGLARKRRGRSPARTRLQPPGRTGVRADAFRRARRLGRAAGMVRRNRNHRGGRGRRLRRHAFRRHRNCFAGCIRKDDRGRRRVSHSCCVLDQHRSARSYSPGAAAAALTRCAWCRAWSWSQARHGPVRC